MVAIIDEQLLSMKSATKAAMERLQERYMQMEALRQATYAGESQGANAAPTEMEADGGEAGGGGAEGKEQEEENADAAAADAAAADAAAADAHAFGEAKEEEEKEEEEKEEEEKEEEGEKKGESLPLPPQQQDGKAKGAQQYKEEDLPDLPNLVSRLQQLETTLKASSSGAGGNAWVGGGSKVAIAVAPNLPPTITIRAMSRVEWEGKQDQIKAKGARVRQQQLSARADESLKPSATSAAAFQSAAFEMTRDQAAAKMNYFSAETTSHNSSSQKQLPPCTPCTASDALLLKAAMQMQAALAHTLDHLSNRALRLTLHMIDGTSFAVYVPATGTAADLCAAVEQERGIEPFLQELFLMRDEEGDGGQDAAVVWHGHGGGGVGGDAGGMQQGDDDIESEDWGGLMLPQPGAADHASLASSQIGVGFFASTNHAEKVSGLLIDSICSLDEGGWASSVASVLSEWAPSVASVLSEWAPSVASVLSEWAASVASVLSEWAPSVASVLSEWAASVASVLSEWAPSVARVLKRYNY
jgi:hypothetical protein